MKESNYILYQKKVSKIEENVISQNYKEVLSDFEILISEYEYIFPRDAYLATQVACYVNENNVAEKFLIQAIKSGCSLEILKRNKHIKLIINHLGRGFFEDIFIKYSQEYEKKTVTKAREDIRKLFKEDRLYLIQYFKLYNFFFRKKNLAKWNKFSLKASADVRNIIKEVGFPSYRIIGTDNDKDYEKGGFLDHISSHLAVILLTHDYESLKYIIKDLLEEVNNGNLSPRAFVFLRDVITYKRHKKGVRGNDEFDLFKYGAFSIFDKTINNIDQYNTEREKLGLSRLEIEKSKQLMNKQFNNRFFNNRYRNLSKPVFHFTLEGLY